MVAGGDADGNGAAAVTTGTNADDHDDATERNREGKEDRKVRRLTTKTLRWSARSEAA